MYPVLLLLPTGAEIGVLSTLPFDKINVNMFLIEMFHFTGEKEIQVMLKIQKVVRVLLFQIQLVNR